MSELIDRIYDVEAISKQIADIMAKMQPIKNEIEKYPAMFDEILSKVRKSKGTDDLIKQGEDLQNTFVKGQKTAKDYQSQLDELNAKTEKLTGAEKAAAIAVEKAKIELQAATKSTKDAASAAFELDGKNKPLIGSYNSLVLQLKNSIASYKELTVAEQKSADGGALLKKIQDTQKSLKGTDALMGNYQRNVGNYGQAIEQLPGIFGEMASSGQTVLVALRTKFESVRDATMQYKEAVTVAKEAQEASTIASEAAAVAEVEITAAQIAETAAKEASTIATEAATKAQAEFDALVVAGTVTIADAAAVDAVAAEATLSLTAAQEAEAVTASQTAAAEIARAAATEAATVATEASAGAMKILRVALISTGIGAIVILLGSLVAWFTQTETGALALQKGMDAMSAIFKLFSGFLAKTVQGVIDFVDGIKSFPDLMSKIGKAIEENLLNRLKSIGTLFNGLGEIMSGDFIKGAKDVVDGLGGIGTGVLNITDKIAKIGKAVATSVSDAAITKAKIDQMKKDLDDYGINSTVALAKLEAKAAEYKIIMEKVGQSLSVKEREDAINGLLKNEDAQLAIKVKTAKMKADIAKAELDLEQKQTGDAMNETRKKNADAQAELIKVYGEYNESKLTISARSAKLYLQILTEQIASEKGVSDQSKLMLENRLKTENLNLDERLDIIHQIEQADNLSYKQQTDSFQQYIDSTTKGNKKIIDFNELMQISDGQVLQARMNELGMSIQAQKLLITLINDRKTAIVATNQQEIDITKKRVNLLISNAQQEIALNNLKNKEIRAGRQSTYEEELSDLSNQYDNEQKQLDLKHENDLISEEDYLKAQELLDQKYLTDKAGIDAQNNQLSLGAEKMHIDNLLSLTTNSIDQELQLKYDQIENERQAKIKAAKGNADMINAINEEAANKDAEAFRVAQDKKQKAFEDFANNTGEIAGALADYAIKQSQQRVDELGKEKDASDEKFQKEQDNLDGSIMSDENRVAKQKELNDKKAAADKVLADKIQAEKIKQAKWERENGIIQATITMGLAILKAATTIPFIPLGLIAVVAATAIGAIQIASIVNTKIPAYGTGTDNHPGGLSIWGELQPEIATTPDGQTFMVDKPTLTNFDAGTKIYKSVSDYENFIGKQAVKEFSIDYDKFGELMPKLDVKIDAGGLLTVQNKQGSRRTVINRRCKLG